MAFQKDQLHPESLRPYLLLFVCVYVCCLESHNVIYNILKPTLEMAYLEYLF